MHDSTLARLLDELNETDASIRRAQAEVVRETIRLRRGKAHTPLPVATLAALVVTPLTGLAVYELDDLVRRAIAKDRRQARWRVGSDAEAMLPELDDREVLPLPLDDPRLTQLRRRAGHYSDAEAAKRLALVAVIDRCRALSATGWSFDELCDAAQQIPKPILAAALLRRSIFTT